MAVLLVRFKNAENGRWLARNRKDFKKVEAWPAKTPEHECMNWILRDEKYIEHPEKDLRLYARKEKKPGKDADKDIGLFDGDYKDQVWTLQKVEKGVIIENAESKRRFYVSAGGIFSSAKLGATTAAPEAKSRVWEMVILEDKSISALRSLTDKLDDIPWDEIAEKAKKTGVSMKEAAIEMGVSVKQRVEDIPWDEIAEKAKAMGVSMKEAAKKVNWEEMAEKARAMAEAVKDKLDEIPWDEIAEKAKKTGVSMKEAAMEMGVSMKQRVEDIPWDEIAEKAKAMGVSMKEAAKKVNWEEMAEKARAMAETVKDKMEDLAETAQEKAGDWCSCCDPAVNRNEVNIAPRVNRAELVG